MPDLERNLTKDEFDERFDVQCEAIAAEIVLFDDNIGVDEFAVHEVTMEEIYISNDIWEDATSESIAEYADTESFNPYEQIELSHPAETLITSIAHHSLRTKVADHLASSVNRLDQTQMIHLFLKRLHEGYEREPEQPSIILSGFNKWLASQFAEDGVVASPFDYEDFNEQHIRGMQAIDYTNTELVDYLWDWLTSMYESFPESLTESRE